MTAVNWLLRGSIARTLRDLALPTMLGSATLILFNLIDTWYISQLGDKQLAAISFTFPVTFTVISVLIGLGIGLTALVAKSLGQGNELKAREIAADGLLLGIGITGLIAYFGLAWHDAIFAWLGADRFSVALIRDYMSLWFPASMLLSVSMLASSVLRAFGDMKRASAIMALGGLINAILDPLLIFGPGPFPALGMRGAVLSTLLSWLISMAVLIYTLTRRQLLYLDLATVGRLARAWRDILRLALPVCSSTLQAPLALILMYWLLARLDPGSIGAWGVGSRIEAIMMLPVTALTLSLPVFISQNLGAGQLDRIYQALASSFRLIVVIQLLLYVLGALLASWIATSFTDTWETRNLIRWYIYLVPLGFAALGVFQLTVAAFHALHQQQQAMRLTALRLFGLQLPLSVVLGVLFGTKGLFIAVLVTQLVVAPIAIRRLSAYGEQLASSDAPDASYGRTTEGKI